MGKWGSPNKACIQLIVLYQFRFPSFDNLTIYIYMLALGKGGYVKTLDYFATFCKSKMISKQLKNYMLMLKIICVCVCTNAEQKVLKRKKNEKDVKRGKLD